MWKLADQFDLANVRAAIVDFFLAHDLALGALRCAMAIDIIMIFVLMSMLPYIVDFSFIHA